MDLVLAVAVAALIAILLFLRRPRGFPPGPRGLPILGIVLSIRKRDYDAYTRWGRQFGPIYTVHLFGQPTLVLNSFSAIHEAFVGHAEAFAGRPHSEYISALTHHSGIVFQDGSRWSERRRFLLRVLRDFGAGRKQGEMAVQEECAALVAEIGRMQGGVDTRQVFVANVNNVIARFTFGERCGADDPGFKGFAKDMKRLTRFGVWERLPMIIPLVWRVKPLYRLFKRLCDFEETLNRIYDYIYAKVEEHKLPSPPPSLDEARDVCEAILIEQARQGVESKEFKWQAIRELMELFFAGTETTASTLCWVTALLATHPSVQEDVHREIEAVVGRERLPAMSDRTQMPLVSAVVDEVLRFSSLVGINLPHKTTAEVEIMGYRIPANTPVMSNLYNVHRDPEVWERPHEFFPGHFLDKDGNYRPNKHLIPFSMGKRSCLGEFMARMEVFLMTVSIFQTFSVRLEDPDTDVDKLLNAGDGGIRLPLPHKILFSKLD